jgi:hypothetical protein
MLSAQLKFSIDYPVRRWKYDAHSQIKADVLTMCHTSLQEIQWDYYLVVVFVVEDLPIESLLFRVKI